MSFSNALMELIDDLKQKVPHNMILSRWDSNRGKDWFVPEDKYKKETLSLKKKINQLEAELRESHRREEFWEKEVQALNKTTFIKFNEDECWIYQDDGENYLDTLICPVVMSAEQCRRLESSQELANKLIEKLTKIDNKEL